MQRSVEYIRKELDKTYSGEEIEGFIAYIFDEIYNYSKYQILFNSHQKLGEDEFIRIKNIVERLKKHEPIQYILESAHFFGLKFKVTPKVLIPRGETEELVDYVVKKTGSNPVSVIDLGTGSGCIPVSLKKHLPEASVSACDISNDALKIAQENAQLHGVDVHFFNCDILAEPSLENNAFDIVISNPPYVRREEAKMMNRNVLEHEPHLALFVDNQRPLIFYEAIAKHLDVLLKDDGFSVLEINEAFGKEVVDLFEKYNFNARIIRDIHGKDRMVEVLRRPNETKDIH